MTFMAGLGAEGTAAWMTISHDHEEGTVSFVLECPHGRTQITGHIAMGAYFPDEPEQAVLAGQAGVHERVYGCGCATRFLSIQQTMTDGRRSDA